MKYIIVVMVLVFLSCNQATKKKTEIAEVKDTALNKADNQEIDLSIYTYEELEPVLHKTGDKIYVVNFWATWCGPCVKELPYFEKLGQVYKDKDVEVLLVSLDFSKQYETKLIPFIKNNNIQSEVVALNDPDSNSWIPKVNKDWSGSIPATIIYTKDKRKFYEKSFTYDELKLEINQFIN